MNQLNIGFIGGCINHQKGLAINKHYHSILMRQINDQFADINCTVSLAVYLSMDKLVRATAQFIEKKKPKLLVIFIRPFSLMPLYKPLIKYKTKNGKINWGVHPKITQNSLNWEDKFTAHQTTRQFEFVGRRQIELRDINLMLGFLLGLEKWAQTYVANQIVQIKKIAASNHIELFVISPPKNPESLMGNFFCGRMSKYLKHFCDQQQINYINMFNAINHHFKNDKIHLNTDGHRLLADLIFNNLNKHYMQQM